MWSMGDVCTVLSVFTPLPDSQECLVLWRGVRLMELMEACIWRESHGQSYPRFARWLSRRARPLWLERVLWDQELVPFHVCMCVPCGVIVVVCFFHRLHSSINTAGANLGLMCWKWRPADCFDINTLSNDRYVRSIVFLLGELFFGRDRDDACDCGFWHVSNSTAILSDLVGKVHTLYRWYSSSLSCCFFVTWGWPVAS